MVQTRPLSIYFCPFHIAMTNTVYTLTGIQTGGLQDDSTVGANESTELCSPPLVCPKVKCIYLIEVISSHKMKLPIWL